MKPLRVHKDQKAGFTRECPYCQTDISFEATICPACGGPIIDPESAEAEQIVREPRSFGLIIGGTLLLFVGVAGVIVGGLLISMGSLLGSLGASSAYSDLIGSMTSIGGIGVLLSLGVIAGGFFAFRRSNFVLSIVGAEIALVIGIASPIFIGSILGFIATVLIAMSHNEFK